VSFRLLTYNIRYGGTSRETALAAVIGACAPDLVVLQEATHPPVVERLAKALGMGQWASRAGASVGFLSREPVTSHAWRRPRWSKHAFMEIVPAAGRPLIFGLHLSAVHSNWTERRRMMEVRSLLDDIRAQDRGFHVVAGDFNTLAPGELLDLSRLPPRLRTITWLTGRRIRWQTVSLMLNAAYVDSYRLVHPDGRGFTFPTWDPHLRLDYAFISDPGAPQVRACEVVTHAAAREASDHLPLLLELD
jgi:endonuclease/exonuclease/phosphatase family metal-dependent hydrolase